MADTNVRICSVNIVFLFDVAKYLVCVLSSTLQRPGLHPPRTCKHKQTTAATPVYTGVAAVVMMIEKHCAQISARNQVPGR